MSTLQIRKLESGSFKHADSIDGEFFLGRFSFKQELNKAFLVEAYGAKKREYDVLEISVFDYLGTAELFTNFTDLENRLTELGYTGIDTNGIIPTASSYISSDADNALQLGADNKLFVPKNETIITNASVSGTYNIDYSAGDVWRLTLTGNTTLTESNLPASGKTKTINLQVNGNFSLTYPAGWTGFITGSYIGTSPLNTITVQTLGTDRKVQIVQPT